MERRKSEEVGDVIRRFLRLAGLESPLNEYRLVQSWGEVAGKNVEEFTQNLVVRNQTLFVKLRSPALRANLLMRRAELVRKLNEHVGANVIIDIVFN